MPFSNRCFRKQVSAAAIMMLTLAAGSASAALTTETIATGFSSPVHVTSPPGETARLFVVEQGGVIRIIDRSDNSILATPFLDISGTVVSGGERGLFALAFHPDYASNGYFFVHYSGAGGDTVVSRFTVSGNPNVANAASELVYFELDQPNTNHNGGMISFREQDAGNYLYIALGDGGGSGDPDEEAQDISSPYGAILRIDVDAGPGVDTSNPNVPASNPFVGVAGHDAIWAYGLRNPWRTSFDRLTGDLYIGDVGQGASEEIDFEDAASVGGLNFGWDLLEASLDFECGANCDDARANTVLPIHEYVRAIGRSVTGGNVYRGSEKPFNTGRYFFADFFSRMWVLEYDGATVSGFSEITSLLNPGGHNIPSFGEDGAGELYFTDFSGAVRRITDTDSVTPVADCWFSPAYTGRQFGTFTQPYYTFANALAGTANAGTLHIPAGDYPETGTFDQPATWVAEGGAVRFGVSPARGSRSTTDVGFVSRDDLTE